MKYIITFKYQTGTVEMEGHNENVPNLDTLGSLKSITIKFKD